MWMRAGSAAPGARTIRASRSTATTSLLIGAARDPRWERPLASRLVLFLGAISYSLYLYHASVGWRFVSLLVVAH
jgi:peptidoglycan/LPS O-acetylase OafA/YrhL